MQPTDAFNFESGVYCVVVMRKVKEKKVDMVIKSVQGGGFEQTGRIKIQPISHLITLEHLEHLKTDTVV